MSRANPELWRKLGLTFATWADSTFLYGVGQLGTNVYRLVLEATGQRKPPLDWDYPFQELYREEKSVLWVRDLEERRSFLPQTVIFGPPQQVDEESVSVGLESEDFMPPMPVDEGFEFYKRNADGTVKKHFFDGENARLIDWSADPPMLVFQGSCYFDYLKTNLALDAPLPPIGTLRECLATNGRIEPLNASKLANATGINALLFSNDGYMVFQKRSETVLVRPGELCSGFSGTIDKIDVVHTVGAGGRLKHLDVLREMVEEMGIQRGKVKDRRLLGITRELVRGGTPEMFYTVKVNLPAKEILSLIARDKEGDAKAVFFGPYASSVVDSNAAQRLSQHFWSLVEAVQSEGDGPVSVPFLTNLVLWYQGACPDQAGTDAIPHALESSEP